MKYHLIKRKNKDRRTGKSIYVYYVGFLRPFGNGYAKMKSTGIKAGTKETERQADRLSQQWIKEGLPSMRRENLRSYLLNFWNKEKIEYLKSKDAETGRTYSLHYIYNNHLLIEDYFLPYFDVRGIFTLAARLATQPSPTVLLRPTPFIP